MCSAMAIHELPPLGYYKLWWRSGGKHGVLCTWAPTARSAIRSVREHPSMHGLPHESVVITRCVRVDVRPLGVRRAA